MLFFKAFNYTNICFFYNSISFLVSTYCTMCIYVLFVPYMDSESEDSLRHHRRHVSSETVFISHIGIFDQNENGITHPRIIILEWCPWCQTIFLWRKYIYLFAAAMVFGIPWGMESSQIKVHILVSRDGLGTRNLYVEGLEIFSVLATFFGSIDDFSLETLKNH